jgi:hypothetical protein
LFVAWSEIKIGVLEKKINRDPQDAYRRSAENAERKENMDSCFHRNDNVKNSAGSANSAVKQTL